MPQACDGCATPNRPLYLHADGRLSFKPVAGEEAADSFVSDPAKPVPYRTRPIRPQETPNAGWRTWLTDDQRFADGRPDMLTYTSDVLTAPVTLTLAPVAHLSASTSGTDADWVVLRGRYRDDPAHPTAIPAGQTVRYTLPLSNVDYVFRPGHRIMVQIQSSWFRLYDRNPQRLVPDIFFARPGDYQPATERVFHARVWSARSNSRLCPTPPER